MILRIWYYYGGHEDCKTVLIDDNIDLKRTEWQGLFEIVKDPGVLLCAQLNPELKTLIDVFFSAKLKREIDTDVDDSLGLVAE